MTGTSSKISGEVEFRYGRGKVEIVPAGGLGSNRERGFKVGFRLSSRVERAAVVVPRLWRVIAMALRSCNKA